MHLESARGVVEGREEVLDTIGLEGVGSSLARQTADLSDRIADLVRRGEGADGRIGELDQVIHEIKKSLEQE
jgi:hypothetical protein